jgi:hypothetical protein
MSSDPPDGWVRARAACCPAVVFKQLEMDATTDVAAINEIRGPDVRLPFRVTANNAGNTFLVHRENIDPYGQKREVRFSAAGEVITIIGVDGATLTATLTLNDEGQCRLKVAGKEYEQWQLRKMVLEPLLFG